MQIGKLDERITIQRRQKTNVSGDVIDSWVDVDTVWASVKTERGNEAFESARLNAKSTIRVMIRYRTDIQSDWRFQWEGQFYYVTAVDYSGRRKGELWITAQVSGAK